MKLLANISSPATRPDRASLTRRKRSRVHAGEAKIVNLTFHHLRHTWSSRAAEMGVSEHVRRDILGHSATSMTGDFTHASTEEMEWAMELVASYETQERLNREKNLGKISANRKRRTCNPLLFCK